MKLQDFIESVLADLSMWGFLCPLSRPSIRSSLHVCLEPPLKHDKKPKWSWEEVFYFPGFLRLLQTSRKMLWVSAVAMEIWIFLVGIVCLGYSQDFASREMACYSSRENTVPVNLKSLFRWLTLQEYNPTTCEICSASSVKSSSAFLVRNVMVAARSVTS